MQLLQNIMRSTELRFPSDIKDLSSDCMDMCQKLLRRNPGICYSTLIPAKVKSQMGSLVIIKFKYVYIIYIYNLFVCLCARLYNYQIPCIYSGKIDI